MLVNNAWIWKTSFPNLAQNKLTAHFKIEPKLNVRLKRLASNDFLTLVKLVNYKQNKRILFSMILTINLVPRVSHPWERGWLTIYLIGREGPSRFLFNIFSFSSSFMESNFLVWIFAGLDILRKPSFALLALPPSSRLSFVLGDADLTPPDVEVLELFRRGNPFLMSLSSRSTMQPSCSSSRGRGLFFFPFTPPALACFAASSSRFFSRALRFSSWMRNCSFSLNEKGKCIIKSNRKVRKHDSHSTRDLASNHPITANLVCARPAMAGKFQVFV